MKKITLVFLICLFSFYADAQNYNYSALSVKSIDSIVRIIKNKNKLLRYKAIDSSLSKFYFVDKRSKELLAVEIINHYYTASKRKAWDYYRFIYYFHKEELIKLYVIQCTGKKDCKKGIFYFSNREVIHKEAILTEEAYLKRPLEFLLDFKSFVSSKNNGG